MRQPLAERVVDEHAVVHAELPRCRFAQPEADPYRSRRRVQQARGDRDADQKRVLHDAELTALAEPGSGIANVHLDAVEHHDKGGGETLVFMHAVKDGPADRSASIATIYAALDAGVTLLDTGDFYGMGHNELLLREALKGPKRGRAFIQVKFGAQRDPAGGFIGFDTRPAAVKNFLAYSLRRLGTDHIDLYQIHRPDPRIDLEETLGALTDLVRQGKVRYAGCSTFPAWQIVESHWVSERRGLSRFVCEQPPYSILARGIEKQVLPVARRLGMGVLTWSPLASGFLTGRYRKGRALDLSSGRPTLNPDRFDPSAPRTAAKLDVVEQLVAVAEEVGCTLPELAIAFPLAHPAVTSVIIGPRTMEHLRATLKGASVALDDAALDRIDAIVPPGTDVYPPDGAWTPPSLTTPSLRRRAAGARAAV